MSSGARFFILRERMFMTREEIMELAEKYGIESVDTTDEDGVTVVFGYPSMSVTPASAGGHSMSNAVGTGSDSDRVAFDSERSQETERIPKPY